MLSRSLKSLASETPGVLLAILRKAELARTTNFDLLEDSGNEMLVQELSADFPYLTMAELNAIIMLGIKGKLDKYRMRPLNFTRIYQWVEQEAPNTLSFWQQETPELMEWAEKLKLTKELLDFVRTRDEPIHRLKQFMPGQLGHLCKQKYWPTINTMYIRTPETENEGQAGQWDNFEAIAKKAWPEFAAKHPEFALMHRSMIDPR